VPLRIVLDEGQFRDLVAGRVVADRRRGVEIMLADIGFARMAQAIAEAIERRRPPDPPEAREFLPWHARRRSR
jgi:hypothetical protein